MYFEVNNWVTLWGNNINEDNSGENGKVVEVREKTLIVRLENDDQDKVEVSKENCIHLGTCDGCGNWGWYGNFCSTCEDSGLIYD